MIDTNKPPNSLSAHAVVDLGEAVDVSRVACGISAFLGRSSYHMSNKSFPTPNPDDLGRDAAAPNTVATGGESLASVQYQLVLDLLNETPKFTDKWFRLKEEEIQLRSHPDIQESSGTALVRESSNEAEEREADDIHVDEARVENISTSESDRHAIKAGHGRPRSDQFPHDSSGSRHGAKIGARDTEGDALNVIADNFPPASCTESTANKSDSSNLNERKERIAMKRHLKSLPADVLRKRGFKEKPASRKNAEIESAREISSDTCEEAPALQSGVRSDMFKLKSKKKSGIKPLLATPGSTDPFIPESSNVARAYTDMLSPSAPNVLEEEEEENENVIIIPEAFLVDAYASVQESGVGVAELVEPDQSTVSLKKRHACVATIFISAILIALGLAITFITRRNSRNNETTEKALTSFSPSSQPSFVVPSLQPSFFMPSVQPSISIRYEIEKNVLQRNVTFDEMDVTDDRVLALEWIVDKDGMELVASAPSLFQRYILALLAFGFPSLGWPADDKECKWVGVECDMYGHVIMLELSECTIS
jgi:hypothetical protein